MSTLINRTQNLKDRTIIVEFRLAQKDARDDELCRKWGDIKVQVSGMFGDPHDPSYPPFYVSAGPDINLFERQSFQCHFADPLLPLELLQRRANLWGDAIQLQIQNKIILMRENDDNTTMSVNVAM